MDLIRKEIKIHLKLLTEFEPEVIAEFCKLADDYLSNGPNNRKYAIAAKKLSTTPEHIQSIIESIICLLIDSTRVDAGEKDLDCLSELNFSANQIKIIWNFINLNKHVEPALRKFETNNVRFRDLEWRLEAKIASRSLLTQVKPAITIKLHLDSEKINEYKNVLGPKDLNPEDPKQITKRDVIFQTDLNNLGHIINTLELAALESKTERARNFIKAFK